MYEIAARIGLSRFGTAQRAFLEDVPWQRCEYHLQQKAMSHVPRREMQVEVAADICRMFNAPAVPPWNSI